MLGPAYTQISILSRDKEDIGACASRLDMGGSSSLTIRAIEFSASAVISAHF